MPLSFMHVWIAGILSMIVLTPFIVRWMEGIPKRRLAEWAEMAGVIGLFAVTNYVASYTPASTVFGVSIAIPYFVLLKFALLIHLLNKSDVRTAHDLREFAFSHAAYSASFNSPAASASVRRTTSTSVPKK